MTAISSRIVESQVTWGAEETGAAHFVKQTLAARVSGVVAVPLAALFDAFSHFTVAALSVAIAGTRRFVNIAYATNFLAEWNVDAAKTHAQTARRYLALATTSGLALHDPYVQFSVATRKTLLNVPAPVPPAEQASAPASGAPSSGSSGAPAAGENKEEKKVA